MRLETDGTIWHFRVGKAIIAAAELHCYGGVWTLRKCRVAEAYRGRGLQRRLIRERVWAAYRKGAKQVRAWVDPRNSYSLNNLVAEGFRFLPQAPRVFDGVEHVALEVPVQ